MLCTSVACAARVWASFSCACSWAHLSQSEAPSSEPSTEPFSDSTLNNGGRAVVSEAEEVDARRRCSAGRFSWLTVLPPTGPPFSAAGFCLLLRQCSSSRRRASADTSQAAGERGEQVHGRFLQMHMQPHTRACLRRTCRIHDAPDHACHAPWERLSVCAVTWATSRGSLSLLGGCVETPWAAAGVAFGTHPLRTVSTGQSPASEGRGLVLRASDPSPSDTRCRNGEARPPRRVGRRRRR